MSTEEPAWRAELWGQIEERFPLIRNTVTRDAIRIFVEEHILAAEERGRREALSAVGAEIDALAANIPSLKAREVWKAGYQGALATLSVWAKLRPESP
jgi:hypothetical protein